MSDKQPEIETQAALSIRLPITRAVLIGGLIGALLSVLLSDFAHRTVFDTWQRQSPREIGMDNVAVVLVDDVSVKDLGAWPWSRYTVARLIDNIGAAKPAAIGIDVYFSEPDPLRPDAFAGLYEPSELDDPTRQAILALPQWDAILSRVLGQDPVVLARAATQEEAAAPENLFFNSTIEGTAPAGVIRGDRVIASIPALDDNVLSHGMVNGPPDADGVVRRVPLGVQVAETSAPGFALELARIASGSESLKWDGDALFMDGTRIPTDGDGRMLFKMGYYPNPAIYPAAAVALGQIPAEAFEGKVVLVGVGA
ncbi:MAG: CHASE2 domain-containing protein, partial [Erythrobacter sp.]|nr:CHASE2 domain-containing protein [Erythrobacter sp.]